MQISELISLNYKRINSSISGAVTILPVAKSLRMVLGEVKARELKIVRRELTRLEMQIRQYTSVNVSRDQVDIAPF